MFGVKLYKNGILYCMAGFPKLKMDIHLASLLYCNCLSPSPNTRVRLNDEARRLFEELGSTAVKELTFRDSWVFVGAKGIENKSPFEQVDYLYLKPKIYIIYTIQQRKSAKQNGYPA